MMDAVKITPWSGAAAPGETDIRKLLASEGLRPYRWSNGPYDVYSAHRHSYNKVIVVVTGSIEFGLPETGRRAEIRPGDRLELPAGVLHDARVGAAGVVCLEAHC